eukprot:3357218-Amphidinium_carterae.1
MHALACTCKQGDQDIALNLDHCTQHHHFQLSLENTASACLLDLQAAHEKESKQLLLKHFPPPLPTLYTLPGLLRVLMLAYGLARITLNELGSAAGALRSSTPPETFTVYAANEANGFVDGGQEL